MSETPSIRPALTPEEWAKRWVDCGDMAVRVREGALDLSWGASRYDEMTVDATAADQLKLAARILHSHPQGFTREDVDFLHSFGQWCRKHGPFAMGIDGVAYGEEWPESLAARIEALLPPEGV